MENLMIEIPEDVLVGTGQSREDFVREARFLLAAKLFEMGRLSSGKAATLCGMGRVDFILAAGRAGVPVIQLDEEELRRELADA
jgi:predicted HTH domain antitoxin